MDRKEVKIFFEQYGNEIIEMRKNGEMVKDIAAKFNRPVQTISTFLIRNGVRIRVPLSDDDKQIILERYLNGEIPKQICKDFHITPSKVLDVIRELGYEPRDRSSSRRIYTINENYFDSIDHQNKAYIIGLLIADGCRGKDYSITISLQESDVGILKKINTELGSNRPLGYRNLSEKNPNHSNQYVLSFNGIHITGELEKYGITHKKDFTTFFPVPIPEEYYSHLIRGILDGDGCIYKKECRCSITGNNDLIIGLKDYIESTLNVHCGISSRYKDTMTRDLRISGRNQVKKFLDYIYKDAELYIDRKYQLYKEVYCSDKTILSLAS